MPEDLLVLCAWCHSRWKQPDGTWTTETPERIRHLPPGQYDIPISHGICPSCMDKLRVTEASAE